MPSVKEIRAATNDPQVQALCVLVESLRVDVAALRAAILGINAKLDLDGGVTGTDFASLWNPAAQTTTA